MRKGIYKDTERGGYYFVVSYKYLDGYKQKKSKRFRTIKECEAEREKFKASVSTDYTEKTINELIAEHDRYYKKQVQPSTYEGSKYLDKYISDLIGNIRLNKLTKKQYEQFLDEIDAMDMQAHRKNLIVSRFKRIAKFSKAHYQIGCDYPEMYPSFKDVKMEKEKLKFYTYEQFQKYIAQADDIRLKSLFTTLYFCGLRVSEGNALTFSDVDFEKSTISISKSVNTKLRGIDGKSLVSAPKTSSSIRMLRIPKRALESLKTMYDYYSPMVGFDLSWKCFGGIDHIPDSTIHQAHRRYVDKAELPFAPVHSLRHSCCSLLLNNGASILMVARYLGDSVEMTLNTYSHFFEQNGEEVVSKIDELTK